MALLVLPIYLFFYIAWWSLVLFAAFCRGVVWLCVRIWQTRPRAAAPQLAASHLWTNRAARDELRRVKALPVMYPSPAVRSPEDCVPYGGHVYYRPTIDKAWAAAPTKMMIKI